MIGPRRSVGPGDVEQGGEPRPAALAHDLQPLDDEGAVEAGQRHDVGDRRERHEIERGDEVRRLAPVPEAGFAQSPVQRDQRHEHHARGRQMAEAREIVRPVRVDERERLRQRLGSLVVVEHDHVEAEPRRRLERLVAHRPAVDGDDERRAALGEALDRLGVRAVAFRDAVGDMDDRLAAAGAEIFADERRAAGAVDVVVAEDRDALAPHGGGGEAHGRRLHVAQDEGVGHQVAQGRVEIALDRLRRDAAACENPGEELVVAADLGDGERARLACAVEPRPPRPSERRALDIEEVTGRRHARAPSHASEGPALPRESPHRRPAEEHHARERGDPEAGRPVGIVGERQSSPGFCERERGGERDREPAGGG